MYADLVIRNVPLITMSSLYYLKFFVLFKNQICIDHTYFLFSFPDDEHFDCKEKFINTPNLFILADKRDSSGTVVCIHMLQLSHVWMWRYISKYTIILIQYILHQITIHMEI